MQSIAPQQRDRHGSAKKTKQLSWRLITSLQRDYDAATDADQRLKIGRLLANALAGHVKLIEVADHADRLKAIEKQLGDEAL